ncbi:helix-turn-helix transcriptional regulator [Aeromicrobium chenweiae]|uniref:LuxR family transcriptional regulator n=1 Tax=Aeromicrobium chenweiae TaxID=2079793 RepID=A0A2S0WMV4_9ACTN|nr:LuxR family transcriptional regulator [Aeromicrobium chenweiae]AWB92600.1 LuxR family transcriptional regulator [Aeromicrobium chenweiae]TGN33588.1 helix-turn-helix transcriptional regulator [Aeromicrobium chenweiae]
MELIGRRAECRQLDEVLHAVRSGAGRALVLRGYTGVGKSALMEYAVRQAAGCRVVRVAGFESEKELAYAGLQHLCTPILDRLDQLPDPQRDALSTAFGLSAGPVPDQMLIGLAVLSLMSHAAEGQPLICVIDDLQWLDRASVRVLSFVARRLAAESTAIFMATRTDDPQIANLPTMEVEGLGRAAAAALLDTVWTGPLDERVRQRIIAETRGNPLALIELPHDLMGHELAGGFGMHSPAGLSARIEESFLRRVEALPHDTRRLLLIAAAEPTGDPTITWRAGALLGIDIKAAAPAVADGLAEFGVQVRFRHCLVRSATYRSAPLQELQMVHQALADVTDAERDPDRRAWHRAQAARGPDESVAAELERCADRARARGGLAAAAAFLEYATMLTLDPNLRVDRALAAAGAKVEAGAYEAAADLLDVVEQSANTDHQAARAELLRARLAYVVGRGSDAPPLLLKAARRLAPIDPALSRATHLHALQAAISAGRLSMGGVMEVAEAARNLSYPADPTLTDLLLKGFSTYCTEGIVPALPILRRAVAAARGDVPEHERNLLWLAGMAALPIWDGESWDVLSARHVELARRAGALAELPLALISRSMMLVFSGELTAAGVLLDELKTVTEATGLALGPEPGLVLAAFSGDQAEVRAIIESTTADIMLRGEGIWLSTAEFCEALLNNGSGDYAAALPLAERAAAQADLSSSSKRAEVELVEAAVRAGETSTAAEMFARLQEETSASGTDWALGIESRSRALLSEGPQAERLYLKAIERLGRTRMRADLARAHLLYGEWLRRERRRIDARAQLRIAHDMFELMGMAGFAARARTELLATGETVTKRTTAPSGPQLTAQEAQVARLASEGLTNGEVGARLFISPRTVQYHLSKVFTKLGISSRAQLADVLSSHES